MKNSATSLSSHRWAQPLCICLSTCKMGLCNITFLITSGDLAAFRDLKCHTVFKIFCQLSPLEMCKFLLAVQILNRRRHWQPTPVLLPGKSHGWRSLVGCSPWGPEESDMTERLHFHFSLSRIGEGNGNPLQCSCLENSRDWGVWWAAVYGVAQSQTRLKRLSSSSRIFNKLEGTILASAG